MGVEDYKDWVDAGRPPTDPPAVDLMLRLQPIDTAPTDGTVVWLFCDTWILDQTDPWVDVVTAHYMRPRGWQAHWIGNLPFKPTHWAPRPRTLA